MSFSLNATTQKLAAFCPLFPRSLSSPSLSVQILTLLAISISYITGEISLYLHATFATSAAITTGYIFIAIVQVMKNDSIQSLLKTFHVLKAFPTTAPPSHSFYGSLSLEAQRTRGLEVLSITWPFKPILLHWKQHHPYLLLLPWSRLASRSHHHIAHRNITLAKRRFNISHRSSIHRIFQPVTTVHPTWRPLWLSVLMQSILSMWLHCTHVSQDSWEPTDGEI